MEDDRRVPQELTTKIAMISFGEYKRYVSIVKETLQQHLEETDYEDFASLQKDLEDTLRTIKTTEKELREK